MIVTAARIRAFSPVARADLVDMLVSHWAEAEAIGLNTPLRIQHFMAQVATETGGLKRIDENLNYSKQLLLQTFKWVKPQDAERLAHHPEAIANHVYANRLGNGNGASGDGWRYRGSGFIQLTGRQNFRDRGRTIGMPLEDNPDLARQPEPGFRAALAYWKSRPINAAVDANDIVRVRKLVNGGTNGLADARLFFARARRVFTLGEAAEPESAFKNEEIAAVQTQLADLGYLDRKDAGPTESAKLTASLKAALTAFQKAEGLEETGRYDDKTLAALVDQPGATAKTEDEAVPH